MREADDTPANERDRRAQQAAYLRARHNFSQEEIGVLLGGVSQSHVSRLLNHAVERGWLVTELRFDEGSLSPEAMLEIRRILEPQRLVSHFEDVRRRTGRITPNVRVFDSGSDSPTPGAFEIRCRRFGRTASGRLEELLRKSRRVGVAWGRTISSLVDGLSSANKSFQPDEPIVFAPVSAELITLAAPEYSSSLLASRLNVAVNKGQGEKLQLGGIPAYLPKRYDGTKLQAIREYLLDAASYRRIFAGDEALVHRLDMVITSVGSAERPLGGAMGEILSAADISAEDLRTMIAGDVGGILLPKPDLPAKTAEMVAALNAMWTGITLQQLVNIAARSAGADGSGVVVAAIGRERAGIVVEAIRLELVNELIVDRALANALEDIFV